MLRPLGFTLLKLCRSANIICEQIRISRAGCCGRFSDRSTKVLPSSISPPTGTTRHHRYIVHVEMRVPQPRISGKRAVNQRVEARLSSFLYLSFPFPSFLASSIFLLVDRLEPRRARDRARKRLRGVPSFSLWNGEGRRKKISDLFLKRRISYMYTY